MSSSFHHQPVLLGEVLAAVPVGSKRLLDATVGGGGHAAALLQAHPDAALTAIDRDPRALAAAQIRLAPFAPRVRFLEGPFADVGRALAEAGQTFDFALADFGVSSPQLDRAERGFSFRMDGPLDMRMAAHGETAGELIARIEPGELADLLFNYGEERRSRPVARAIVAARPATTVALAQAVYSVLGTPKRHTGAIDPATRTFMALRMAVNDELGQIRGWLQRLEDLLAPTAVMAAISFHSLEDRLVKRAISPVRQGPCTCPPDARECSCGPSSAWRPLSRGPIVAGEQERARNPRSRSAKLRCAQRVAADAAPGAA